MNLQFPIILMVIYFIVIVIRMEDTVKNGGGRFMEILPKFCSHFQTLYNRLSTFILPFIGLAAIVSTWAAEMVMAMFIKVLPGFNIKVRFYNTSVVNRLKLGNFQQKHIAVVLVLLFCKFQPLIAQIEFSINGENWHQYPVTKGIFSNSK